MGSKCVNYQESKLLQTEPSQDLYFYCIILSPTFPSKRISRNGLCIGAQGVS